MLDANPDVVHGKDSAEGIALWAKQPTFESLREMIPRGYESIKDVPVVSLNCEVSEAGDRAQTIQNYTEARQKASGFDPSRGKGDLTPSKSFSQRVCNKKGLAGEVQRQHIKKFKSMAVKVGLRRVDSLTDLNEIKNEEENRSEEVHMTNWSVHDLLGESPGNSGERAEADPADD